MNPRDSEFLAIIAAILISGTTHTADEGIAKAKALLVLADKTTKETERND